MSFPKGKKGISLVEVLIAISLFSIIAIVAGGLLADIAKLERKTSVQNAIYEDLRIILQQIANEVHNGAIDYEEYYNYYVLQGGEGAVEAYYGINYGVYGSRFYDPGKSLVEPITKNPKDLGVECSFPNPLLPADDCEIVYTLSMDLNTGQNPFTGNNPDESNAFIDKGVGQTIDTGITDHLFLIDNTGTKKTIISRKRTGTDDWGIGMVRMEGMDIDQNGFVDTFTCAEEYDCFGESDPGTLAGEINLPFIEVAGDIEKYGITVPHKIDLETVFALTGIHNFVPITPLRSDIKELLFIINPLDDPYKAYAEPSMQSHPSVTIIITLGLSEEVEANYPGEFEPITVQATIAAGVIGRIESYPPINDVKSQGNPVGWIEDLVPPMPSVF